MAEETSDMDHHMVEVSSDQVSVMLQYNQYFNYSMQKMNFWKAKWVKERAKWVNRKSKMGRFIEHKRKAK